MELARLNDPLLEVMFLLANIRTGNYQKVQTRRDLVEPLVAVDIEGNVTYHSSSATVVYMEIARCRKFEVCMPHYSKDANVVIQDNVPDLDSWRHRTDRILAAAGVVEDSSPEYVLLRARCRSETTMVSQLMTMES
jgi:hypothetical protein